MGQKFSIEFQSGDSVIVKEMRFPYYAVLIESDQMEILFWSEPNIAAKRISAFKNGSDVTYRVDIFQRPLFECRQLIETYKDLDQDDAQKLYDAMLIKYQKQEKGLG